MLLIQNTLFPLETIVKVSIAMKRYHDHNLEKFYFILHFHQGRVRSQGRNLKAGTRGENMEKHCLLTCTAWLLKQLRAIYWDGALPTVMWVFQQQSSTKKVYYYRPVHMPIWWSHFLKWGSLFPNISSLSCWQKSKNTKD